MLFLYSDPMDPNYSADSDYDELTNPEINAVGITLNGHYIWWESNELIKVNFMGIILCVVCIDPQLQNHNKFCNFFKNKFNPKSLKSINFSRIDKSEVVVEYDGTNQYNLFISGLHINLLRFCNGMAGLAYSS